MAPLPRLLANPDDVFRVAADVFGLRERDVALYSRYLREQGKNYGLDMWPPLSHGRGPKYEVMAPDIAYLIIALATCPVAIEAGLYAFRYGVLEEMVRQNKKESAYYLFAELSDKIYHADPSYDVTFWLNTPWVVFESSYESIMKGNDLLPITYLLSRNEEGSIYLPHFAPWISRPGTDRARILQKMCRIPGNAIERFGSLLVPEAEADRIVDLYKTELASRRKKT